MLGTERSNGPCLPLYMQELVPFFVYRLETDVYGPLAWALARWGVLELVRMGEGPPRGVTSEKDRTFVPWRAASDVCALG